MADPITDRLIIMNNLIKDISLGKLYIEDFYKDNGYPTGRFLKLMTISD
jgi:hypothetical protein